MVSEEPVERVIDLFRRADDNCYASETVRSEVPTLARLTLNGREVLVESRKGEIAPVADENWWFSRD